MREFYFEVHITPSDFYDIFKTEILDLLNEAIEEIESLNSPSFIIRTTKSFSFILNLIIHLDGFSKRLSEINNRDVSFTFQIQNKSNTNWIETYKSSVSPIICGSFYIRPPWVDSIDNKIDIQIEPSLAFGTGHHESTYMCIEALEKCNINENTTLLDVGCGSGILSICANKLGARVDICDIDELAIIESRKNFLHNNATINKIWLGSVTGSMQYDIVVSNIVSSVLIDKSYELIDSLYTHSILILSGILEEYKDAVISAYNSLYLLEEYSSGEWICLKLSKQRN